MQQCAVLEKARRDCIPSFTVDSFHDYIILGFTEHLKDLHVLAFGTAMFCNEAVQIAL